MDIGLLAVVVLAGAVLIVGLIGPLFAQRRLRRIRAPTTTDQELLSGLLPAHLDPPDRFVVIETVGESSVEVAIRGPPGYRTLFVTDYVLESLESEIARALLVAEVARAELWYREYQVVAATIAIALGTAGFLLVIPFEAGFGGMLIAAAIMLTIGRRLQYRADASAGEVVGPAVLADAFETVADRHDVDTTSGGWRTYFEVQPPLGDRIHRLRAQD